jgi:hypothetical protein
LEKFQACLGNGSTFEAQYGHANLPILPMGTDDGSDIW